MKLRYRNFALWLLLISSFIFNSCEKDFLNVSDPTVLSTSIFPNKIGDLEYILTDIYGRLQNGYYSFNGRGNILVTHENDHGYNGAEFNEFALNILNPNLSLVKLQWEEPYAAIGKINGFLVFLDIFRAKGTLTTEQLTRLNQMEGEARFIRALSYFYLVNLYGESPISTEADKQKMGVPLWDVAPEAIKESTKARATQGQVYDFIISDLLKAETLLKGVVFAQKPRVNEWAVKGFLGKAYIYNLQFDLAKRPLKDLIDNGKKSLVSYKLLHDMFHGFGETEYNSESVFEVNYTPDKGSTGELPNTGNVYPRYIAVTWIGSTGVVTRNGYANLSVHDLSLPRFGWNDTTAVNQLRPDFVAKSKLVRLNKSVDPRLYVSAYQPFLDSILFEGVWRKVGKASYESYVNRKFKAWNNSKYTNVTYPYRNQQYSELNFIVLRLADIYLLYAEALIMTGDATTGLEYINKVHRRAYDQPINVPSIYDYSTLSDRTITVDPTDPLANDPLKYERWAELFCEFNWWLDVRRFRLGAAETAYYKKVQGGPLQWLDTKYAYPIPTSEMNANSEMIQNPGY